jgi:hypothetical protein
MVKKIKWVRLLVKLEGKVVKKNLKRPLKMQKTFLRFALRALVRMLLAVEVLWLC